MRSKSKGWGFKIDYDQAIREDEKVIAETLRALEHKWFQPIWHAPLATIKILPIVEGELEFSDSWNILTLFLLFPEFAYAAGLTDEDLGVLVYTLDGYEHERYNCFPAPVVGPATYKRSDELLKQIEALWPSGYLYSEEKLRTQLKHAKAALSRHKRNKIKYGS